jgi:exodeoxyribonuclease VII small subunit
VAKFDFEKAMERLEEIIADLESGKLSLDDSIKAFEEGVEISKKCHKKLTEAETKVKQLIKNESGEFELKFFDEEEETPDEPA